MKNKPTKHKETNTFQFKPFSVRIESINIDVYHRILHKYQNDEDDDKHTHFYNCLQKWNNLNLTDCYDEFRKELPPTQTMPLLVLHKDQIIHSITKHLGLKNPLSLQPILELVVALAKDLRKEFYPHYPEVLESLFGLLTVKDADQLEWIFSCLAYLFKFLLNYLIKDIANVLDKLLPLLSDSRPSYINAFAAESFAFVARKVKDQEQFLALILNHLESKDNAVAGCGRLFFEVMRGVSGRFHSCADTLLPFYFQSLVKMTSQQQLLFNLLSYVLEVMCNEISVKHGMLFWKSILNVIDNIFVEPESNISPKKSRSLVLLLKLVLQVSSYNDGIFVTEPVLIIQTLIKVINCKSASEEALLLTSNIIAALLTGDKIKLPQEYASQITFKVLSIPNQDIILNFTEQVIHYTGFETIMLPYLLYLWQESYSRSGTLEKNFTKLMAHVILKKAPACFSGEDLENWQPYYLDFTRINIKDEENNKLIPTAIHGALSNICDIKQILSSLDESMSFLLCLPHFKPMDLPCSELLMNLIHIVCEALTDYSRLGQNEVDSLLLFLSILVETALHMNKPNEVKEICSPVFSTVLQFAEDPKNILALHTIDLYLSVLVHSNATDFNGELLKSLYNKLAKHLSSPFQKIRLLTVHIFSLFGKSAIYNELNLTVFNHCYEAEKVPATIQTYREKLKHLQHLEYNLENQNCFDVQIQNEVCVHYLLSNLYINFQLLWEPVIKLIATHAKGQNISEFWRTFGAHLTQASDVSVWNSVVSKREVESNLTWSFLTNELKKLYDLDDRPDYANHRLLLWQCLLEFPEICEARSRDITPIFIKFLQEEYFKASAEVASYWNIKENDIKNSQHASLEQNDDLEPMETDKVSDVADEDDKSDDENTEPIAMKPNVASKLNAKMLLKTLLAQLDVYAKLRNPKSLYKESELSRIYHDFLSHKNADIQRMALNCVLTYKNPAIIPYQEHLFKLIDNKTFKTEIVEFCINKESDMIQEAHRGTIIPVIMRIMYGKMLSKTGAKRAGKSAANIRRSRVLTFLGGCQEEEMLIFLKMAFRSLDKNFSGNSEDIVSAAMENLDLERVIPPKRLLSYLNLLDVILEKFGLLMGHEMLSYLLQVLLYIGAVVTAIHMRKAAVHSGYFSIIRTLRKMCTTSITKFFDQFQDFMWTNDNIDAVFQVFVWPWLDKLQIEGKTRPTPLLKLFLKWSHHSRYFILLVKHLEGNIDISPLPYVMNLLKEEKLHRSVSTLIMELVEQLIFLPDYGEKTEDDLDDNENVELAPALEISNVIPIKPDLQASARLSYGNLVLLPHIPTILEFLERKLRLSKGKSLNDKDLSILSHISTLVTDLSTSDTLVQLLFPILLKKSQGEEDTVNNLLSTLINLIKNVPDPEKYFRLLSPLFGKITGISSRKLLCKLLMMICEHFEKTGKSDIARKLKIVEEINAWDAKWIEQPDFGRRLDGFNKVHELIQSGELDIYMGVTVIYNAFYFLKTEKDLSLRDSSSFCLVKLAPALSIQYQMVSSERQYIINDVILELIRNGIKDKNELLQQESIGLLGEMVRECSELHPILRDMSKLASKTDLEVDFFENLRHLQTHRKSRALLKFCEVAKGFTKKLNPKTLTQFLLPITSIFICSEKYSHKNSMVDAAISALSTICRLLSWHQYETVLRFYLNKLRHVVDYQKQLVRVVVGILDAFHFDLSRAQNIKQLDNIESVANSQAGSVVGESEQSSIIDEALPDNTSTNANQEQEKAEGEDDVSPEDLDVVLESCADIPEEEEQVEATQEEKELEPVINKTTILARSTATHVIKVISVGLLPQLHHVISEKPNSQTVHKVNKKYVDNQDEDDILRVPIAFAVVKLLQQLPSEMLDHHLSGVLMKLCTFLKSRLDSVRRVTRETLQKVMLALGPAHLRQLLKELTTLLTKGFQVHVLIYTVHSVLVSMKHMFKPGDLDSCIEDVLELCKMELFGKASEEKDVVQITRKLFEAKATKSYDTFQILAEYITEKSFTNLLLPLKEVLSSSHSHKTIQKASECLRRIVLGFADNKFVTSESLLIFVYGTSSQSIPDLLPKAKTTELSTPEAEKLARRAPDSFIIPKAPRSRYGANNITAKTSANVNAHMLVEFGFRLLHTLLKRERVKGVEFNPYLDPLIPLLNESLQAPQVKLTTVCLQCLSWLLKIDLPNLRKVIKELTASIFKLLHKFASAGSVQHDNAEMVVAGFKAITVLVRDVKFHVIDTDQLKALLLYAEQDMQDYNRQATAFTLLKAILSRQLVTPEVYEIMEKVARLSIISEFPLVRAQARQVFHQFFKSYPLKKKLQKYLEFFLNQLNYELKSGRQSALESLQTIISTFSTGKVEKYSGILYTTLGSQLNNEEDPECKKMIASCIKTILKRVGNNTLGKLFDMTMVWLVDKKAVLRCMGAQLCSLFVSVEKTDFEKRVPILLPLLLPQLDREKSKEDHHLFQVMDLTLKLFINCPSILKNPNWQNEMDTIGASAKVMLADEHEWIRLSAAKLFGHLFGALDPTCIAACIQNDMESSFEALGGYLQTRTSFKIRSLILDFCDQLQAARVGNELMEQATKNLVFLGLVVQDMDTETSHSVQENDNSDDESEEKISLSLIWMVKRIRRVINFEIVNSPSSSSVRIAAFKWIGAMAVKLNKERLLKVLSFLISPIVRELTSEEEISTDLKKLAKEVAAVMKKKVGMDEYTQCFVKQQSRLFGRRAERKKLKVQEVITHPAKAAKRKINQQLKKKALKKRKMDVFKGRKAPTRKRKRQTNDDSDN